MRPARSRGGSHLNGRVLQRPRGGVYRYAAEVAAHLDDCRVIKPPSARYPWSARLWEQTVLPFRCRGVVLLNVAHGAPLLHRRNVVVVHDLFAMTHPETVRPVFAALMAAQLPAIVSRAARVVAVSSMTADQVAARFDLARDAITIAPPGISAQFTTGDKSAARRRLGLDPDRPIVAAMIDPAPRKRVGDVAQVFDHIATIRPDVVRITVGRATPAPFAPSTAAIDERPAEHLGELDDHAVADLWRASDVVVCMSPNEGFGLPPVEAAACGAVVVSRAVPSITEFAPQAAELVDSAREAGDVVVRLLDDLGARRHRAAVAVAAVRDLQWTRTAEILNRVLNGVEG